MNVPQQVGPTTSALVGPKFEATKQAILDNDQRRMDAAKTQVAQNTLNDVPTRVRTPLPTPKPRDTPGPGLGECAGGDKVFSLSGCWGGRLNDEFIYINSGAQYSDRSQGAIQVYTTTLSGRIKLPIITYNSPQKEGPLKIAYVYMPRVALIAPHADRPTTMFVFNLQTREWETATENPCRIYPLAFSAETFDKFPVGEMKKQVPLNTAVGGGKTNSGTAAASFAWLSFTPDTSGRNNNPGLPAPGGSGTFMNPDNPNDHILSTGDWIQGRQTIGADSSTRSAFDFLEAGGFIIPMPLWDRVRGQGTNLQYHVSGFAWVYMADHSAFPPTDLSVMYWGQATCFGK